MPFKHLSLALLIAGGLLAGITGFVMSQDTKKDGDLEDVRQGPRPVDPREYRIGQLIEDLSFTDVEGKKGKLSDYADKKALVIFVSTAGCPVCKKYAPVLNQIVDDYKEKDVAFLIVNPAENETVDDCKDAVERYKFSARYIPDPKGEISATLNVKSTGDSFVLDSARTLRYRGAVNDQFGFGYNLDAPRMTYLRDAVDAVLDDREPYYPATWAPGCLLEFDPVKPTGDVTWNNRISRIVQDNCQGCHREGENGPFELMTYKDVRANRSMIKRQVKQRLMPPWFANPEHGDFANDRSLSDSDREAFLSWIDNGCPEGDAKDAPLPRKWADGWKIGKPDAVFEIPKENKVPATGAVPYQYQTITTSFDEDRWIQAMEIRPTSPQVVHHVLVFLHFPRNHPRADEQPDDRRGLNGYFMGMVPGQGDITFPEGQGKFLPKGAKLEFQIHYTTNGEEATDKTKLGMIFCKEQPKTEITTTGISNVFFQIPPGAENHEVKALYIVKQKMRLLSLMPHMHVRGKAYKYVAKLPDGTEQVLLDVPRYDFNWQLLYILREPIDLPKGTKIYATGWFDNSDKNPANPDPKKTVRFGEQTWEEMQIGYINWYALED
ncbi:MAG: redoxin domain-containing protein [Planctomycetes bacterium]|nr:redoxin domain-containing protein [Planctomycetota bacterium]